MRNKKSWAKMISPVLVVAVTLSTYGSNPIIAFAETEYQLETQVDAKEIKNNLVDFVSKEPDKLHIDETNGTITLEKSESGDHFAVYHGLEDKANDFVLEADVKLEEDGISAALIFGLANKENPSEKWYGANFNTADNDGVGQFRIFGVNAELEENSEAFWEGLDRTQTLHLKLDVKKDGSYTYSFGNTGQELKSVAGTISNWQGGYIGILTFNSKATFSNISFENRTIPVGLKEISNSGTYQTNLEQIFVVEDTICEVTEEGLYSNAIDKNDNFLYSQATGSNFVYSTDVIFKQNTGAAALMFRNSTDFNNKNCYVVNLNAESRKCRLWKWQDGEVYDLIDEKEIPAAEGNKYTLKVVAVDSWISYYVNETLVASTGDYTLQPDNKGQDTCLKEGYFGLLNWNGEMVFQNTYYEEIDDAFTPILEDIKITSSGTVEKRTQYVPTEPITIQYVKNNAETVNVEVIKKNTNAEVTIQDESGKVYADGTNIPVAVGKNYLTITSSVEDEKGMKATLTYRVNVHRRQSDEIYYNEPYRDQYHYSVKDGWANDPNGMVYYNGKYHLFYQFYDDNKWGPMHWAHATSTDLLQWEEEPIALYPDANGAMFSGCIVADTTNSSGLFQDSTGGLVALITGDGNGQRIKLAFSEDEGATWTKVDQIAADWTKDPLKDAAFRDPKVFRWENKWFMVIAGGPLRIYSSDNLLEWKCESTYKDLHTECPDLYPLQATDGTLKWVLSRGGRFYKVGDFKEVEGKWTFVPDEDYNKSYGTEFDGVMNFGRDSYAAMTFYEKDFGTVENPTLPENLIEINWMNTWDDYCNLVAEKVGQEFNGTFNLSLKLGLTKEDGKYVLTQTPIQVYETLRDTEGKLEWKDVTVGADNELLKDFNGDCYEILSTFTPAADTKKVGFKLRTGNNQETVVIYDIESETLSIDRSKSGTIISNKFAEVDSQHVTKNADGTIDLHIYVDRASVEVFTKGDTVTGANQIFPDVSSKGASVLIEGGAAKADITVYPMNTIWKDKVVITENTKPTDIVSSASTTNNINVGDAIDLNVSLLPVGVKQEIEWSVDNENIVSMEQDKENKHILHVTGMKKGTVKITAKAKENAALTKEFTINVFENNFNTNIGPFIASGNWFINDEILAVSNNAANDSYMTSNKVNRKEYVLETNLKYERGLINIFFASESTNPSGAYAVQVGSNDMIRLFRFGRDGDIKTASMGKAINDNQFHHVTIAKTENSVTVSIDGTEYLTHTFETVDSFYNDAYVGLGLWDGALEVKGFYTNSDGEIEQPVDVKAPIIQEQPVDNSCNVGEKVTLKVTAESADKGTLSYQWYSNTENSIKGAAEISGAIKESYDVPTNKAGTTYYFCKVTNTNNQATGTKTASIESKIAKVVVTKQQEVVKVDAKAPIVQKQPVDTSCKVGEKVTLKVTAESADKGTLSYQWYSNTENSIKGAAEISGAIKESYDVPTNKAGTTYYFCKVTNTNNQATGTKTASIESKIAKVVVTKQQEVVKVDAKTPVITKNPVGSTCKYKGKITLKVTAKSADKGTLSYQWYSNTKNSTKGAKAVSKATKASYSVPTTKAGTIYYFCKVTNTNRKATGIKKASVNSKIAKVIVKKAENPITNVSKYSKVIGSKVTLKPQGKATYKSANKKVATVTKKGVVTFKGFGKTTITVNAKGNANYKAATKKITIEVIPKTVKINSFQSKKSKTAIVKWKKDTKVTGYKIQYATNSKFKKGKNVTIKKNHITSTTLKKLTGNKKYYVRIRSYKKVDKKTTVYSSWSKVKNVKVKK
ncbi:MAG: GH32 C-terminal domain-containing protein [Lachnospiraceae bacterium]